MVATTAALKIEGPLANGASLTHPDRMVIPDTIIAVLARNLVKCGNDDEAPPGGRLELHVE